METLYCFESVDKMIHKMLGTTKHDVLRVLGLYTKLLTSASCTGTAREELLHSASHFVHATYYANRLLKYT